MEAQQMNRQSASLREVACEACGRRYRRERDKKRHKYIEERRIDPHGVDQTWRSCDLLHLLPN